MDFHHTGPGLEAFEPVPDVPHRPRRDGYPANILAVVFDDDCLLEGCALDHYHPALAAYVVLFGVELVAAAVGPYRGAAGLVALVEAACSRSSAFELVAGTV